MIRIIGRLLNKRVILFSTEINKLKNINIIRQFALVAEDKLQTVIAADSPTRIEGKPNGYGQIITVKGYSVTAEGEKRRRGVVCVLCV